jgi:light-regulated signal transduction histidine kinase (bacteriophytochrome)
MVESAQDLPVIVLTSLGDEELATGALQQGAQDYLIKDDFSSELLARAVRYAIERKRIEERLRFSLAKVTEHAMELEALNRELQEKNRDLDEFSHMISHDLQEPVRHLMVFSHRLNDNLDTRLSEKASFDLERIHAAARRMESSIAGLQVLSQADRQKMNRRRVSLESCVNSSLANLEQSVADSNANISIDPLPEVQADPALLALLFQNLISNALKYRRGEPAVRITAQRDGDEWIFGVRDNGIGIDARHATRIFVAFQRLHAREEYGGGSGLGLTICRKVIERHGGRIWVESTPGEGAHFRFTLGESVVRSLGDAERTQSSAPF